MDHHSLLRHEEWDTEGWKALPAQKVDTKTRVKTTVYTTEVQDKLFSKNYVGNNWLLKTSSTQCLWPKPGRTEKMKCVLTQTKWRMKTFLLFLLISQRGAWGQQPSLPSVAAVLLAWRAWVPLDPQTTLWSSLCPGRTQLTTEKLLKWCQFSQPNKLTFVLTTDSLMGISPPLCCLEARQRFCLTQTLAEFYSMFWAIVWFPLLEKPAFFLPHRWFHTCQTRDEAG